jgi:hypothetical protein
MDKLSSYQKEKITGIVSQPYRRKRNYETCCTLWLISGPTARFGYTVFERRRKKLVILEFSKSLLARLYRYKLGAPLESLYRSLMLQAFLSEQQSTISAGRR